jgi:hypothetical protein
MKKLFSLLLLVCCITAFTQPCNDPPATSNKQPVTSIYRSQINVSEQPAGSNWGPEVSQYLAAVGVKSPAPWCAAFVKWCFDKASIRTTITAWSPTAHNAKNIIYAKGQQLKPPLPGDVFTLYYTNLRRIAHTGFFDGMTNTTIYKTVEGNTNKQGSREGTAVLVKYRSLKSTYSITRWT